MQEGVGPREDSLHAGMVCDQHRVSASGPGLCCLRSSSCCWWPGIAASSLPSAPPAPRASLTPSSGTRSTTRPSLALISLATATQMPTTWIMCWLNWLPRAFLRTALPRRRTELAGACGGVEWEGRGDHRARHGGSQGRDWCQVLPASSSPLLSPSPSPRGSQIE